MNSVTGDTTSLVPGFPIRTSSDLRSVGSSPRHIAASNVLHRLPVPRHPPCALKHLQTQKPKEKSEITPQQTTHPPTPHKRECRHTCGLMLATTIHKSNTTPHHQDGATTETPHQETNASHQKAGTHPTRGKPAGLLPQDPTVCLAAPTLNVPAE